MEPGSHQYSSPDFFGLLLIYSRKSTVMHTLISLIITENLFAENPHFIFCSLNGSTTLWGGHQ